MKKITALLLLGFLVFGGGNSYAATNPYINFSTQSSPQSVQVGGSPLVLTYSLTNETPYPLALGTVTFGNSTLYSSSVSLTGCTYNGVSAIPVAGCTATVTLTGTTAGQATSQALAVQLLSIGVMSSPGITIAVSGTSTSATWSLVAGTPSASSIPDDGSATSDVVYTVTNTEASGGPSLSITGATPGPSSGVLKGSLVTYTGSGTACTNSTVLTPSGICYYQVQAVGNNAGPGSAAVSLSVTTNGQSITQPVNSSTITVTGVAATWTLTADTPNPTSITDDGSQTSTVVYTVTNTDTHGNSLTITGAPTVSSSAPSLLTASLGTYTGSGTACSNSLVLTPTQTCFYTVDAVGNNGGTGSAKTQLTVSTDGASITQPVESTSITLTAPVPATWSLVPGTPSNSSIPEDGSTTSDVVYTVTNTESSGGSSLSITGATAGPTSGVLTGALVTYTGAGTACTNTTVLSPGDICYYEVAGTGNNSGAGSSTVTLDVTTNGASITQPVPSASITVTAGGGTWSLSFDSQSSTSINVGDPVTATYEVTNTALSGGDTLTISGATPSIINSSPSGVLSTPTIVAYSGVGQDCNTLSGGILAPTDSCFYTIQSTGGVAGTADMQLQVATDGSPTTYTAASNSVTVTGSSTTLPLVFTVQPAGIQSINTSSGLDLIYQIENVNTSAAALSSVTFTTASSGWTVGSVTASGTGCTTSTISAGTTCTYTVPLTAGGSTVTASNQILTVDYSVGTLTGQSLVSVPTKVEILALTAEDSNDNGTLLLTQQPSSPQLSTQGGPVTLTYTITNTDTNSGDAPASLSSIAFPPSTLFSSTPAVTADSASCLPHDVSGSVLPGMISSNSSCVYTVTITPATSAAGVTAFRWGLAAPYSTPAGGFTLQSAPVNIQVSDAHPLAFVQQPTPVQNVPTNEALPTLTYQVQNLTHSAVTLTGLSFSSSNLYSGTPSIVISGTGCSTTNIPADSVCTYNVTVPSIISLATPGVPLDATDPNLLQILENQALTLTYSGGTLISNPLTINVTTQTVSTSSSPIYFAAPMPVITASIPTNQMQVLTYGIYNNTGATLNIDSSSSDPNTVTLGAPTASIIDTISSTCVNIAAGDTCYITLSIADSAAETYDDTLTILENGTPLTTPIHIESYTPTDARTITFTNNCPNNNAYLPDNGTIWVGLVPSSAANIKGVGANTECYTNADCLDGSSCVLQNNLTGAKQCVWNTPILNQGANAYGIASGASVTVSIPYEANQNLNYGGALFNTVFTGRTSCTAGSPCETGDCSEGASSRQTPSPFDSTSYCMPGSSLSTGATAAEIGFYLGNVGAATDTYDITIINGVTVPISIAPNISTGSTDNPFSCGIAGNPSTVNSGNTTTNLGGASWSLDWTGAAAHVTQSIPANYFTLISSTGEGTTPCTSNIECTASGQACGFSATDIANGSTTTYCGQFLGFTTPDTYCGANPDQTGPPFYCGNRSATIVNNQTYANLLACAAKSAHSNGAATCYNGSATDTCCGCQNWDQSPTLLTLPSTSVSGSLVTACSNTNLDWIGSASGSSIEIMPILAVLKAACPSCYVFPFDDAGSTFNCGTQGLNQHLDTNVTNYTVTFCPNNEVITPIAQKRTGLRAKSLLKDIQTDFSDEGIRDGKFNNP